MSYIRTAETFLSFSAGLLTGVSFLGKLIGKKTKRKTFLSFQWRKIIELSIREEKDCALSY